MPRGGLRGRWAGRRRGRRARAWRCVDGPGAEAGQGEEPGAVRAESLSGPKSVPVGERLGERGQRGAARCGAARRTRGRRAGERRGGGEEVGEAAVGVVQGVAVRATSRAACVRAAAVETCWPSTARTANSAASDRARYAPAGRLGDQRGEQRVGGSCASIADRVGVQVEHAAAAADRDGQVAQVASDSRQTSGRACGGQRRDRPRGKPQRAAVGAVPPLLDARAPRWRPGGRTGCPATAGA